LLKDPPLLFVLHYAGHGIQTKGKTVYLVPGNARAKHGSRVSVPRHAAADVAPGGTHIFTHTHMILYTYVHTFIAEPKQTVLTSDTANKYCLVNTEITHHQHESIDVFNALTLDRVNKILSSTTIVFLARRDDTSSAWFYIMMCHGPFTWLIGCALSA